MAYWIKRLYMSYWVINNLSYKKEVCNFAPQHVKQIQYLVVAMLMTGGVRYK